MLTVSLNGGLGNMLFQIASVQALAWDNNDECGFDFNVTPIHQGNPALTYRDNIFSKLKDLPKGWRPAYRYTEKEITYQKLPYHSNMLLKGYLGHSKYFDHHKERIRELFSNAEIIENLKNKYRNILKNSVSLHVRHGDYLKFSDVYVIPDLGYYERSFNSLEFEHCLVFSDDMKWCKRNLRDKRITYIEQQDYLDLYLMSLTDNIIMANSSFSWWAVYLGNHQRVITPKKWFKDGCGANQDFLVKDEWIKL